MEGFPFQYNSKNVDLSYKLDLDFGEFLEGKMYLIA